ncbi:MAG TPA: Wzz/FepE/Etk N-terminal domain-containing protein [Anaerolineae bacterium]|nr:Wzz/FepE/Etk N-terminal domain-containing protein [Anaerolineae bacterium]
MELRDYLRILRKRGWIIILTTLLTAAAAWGFSQVQTVEYKSSISVFVRPERIDNGTLLATKQILRGFVAYIDSLNFAQQVINTKGLDMKADVLKPKVTIASKDEDYIIQIDVVDNDPTQSEAIALEWANQFVQWRDQDNLKQQKADRVDANIVQLPTTSKFRPQTTLNVIAGAIIGLLIGVVIVFFLEAIESNILRSSDDVERVLGTTVIGAIPTAGAEAARSRKKKVS